MVEVPSDTMYHILSRMSLKSLARFRCVCKSWCNYIDGPHFAIIHVKEDPTPILFQRSATPYQVSCRFRYLYIMESKQVTTTTTTTLELKKGPISHFPCDRSLMFSRLPKDLVLGSCNGLILSSQDRLQNIVFVVIHPLRKEYCKLPPISTCSGSDDNPCGLGFDDSNNSYKLVCVLYKRQEPVCTKVHVLGTDLWRDIYQVPSYPITGEGIYANGCLHWLRSRGDSSHAIQMHGSGIIYFNVKKEEFGLIDPPKQIRADRVLEKLVDLQGEVGVVYNAFLMNEHTHIEVWLLKKKEWVMNCTFDKIIHSIPRSLVKVIGCWDKDGDLLITTNEDKQLFVFEVKNGTLLETKINGWDWDDQNKSEIRMYQSNLFSVYGLKPLTQMLGGSANLKDSGPF